MDFIKENCFYNNDSLYDIENDFTEIHIAKCSGGWKPCFQKTRYYTNILELENFYLINKNDILIIDEYNTEYTWDQFKLKVIDWNKDIKNDYDNCIKEYEQYYYLDVYGYKWCINEFS